MTVAIAYRGNGEVAQFIQNTQQQLVSQNFAQSATYSKQPAKSELLHVFQDCKNPDWDGEGSYPVSEATFEQAYLFIEALPLGVALPSVGVEPDGCITLEWYRHPRWVLSVSISPNGLLHYAALIGSSNTRGSIMFLDEVPSMILDLIQQVMLHA